MHPPRPFLSIVIPFYNEAENLGLLITELDLVLGDLGISAEILLVNDGSTDFFDRPATTPRFPIRWIDLDRHSGQSAAIYFGIQQARGMVIGLMDADLQNDPADLPRLLETLAREEVHLVTGFRQRRFDSWTRRFTSKIANCVRSFLLKDQTRDTGCSLKVLRRELAVRLPGWDGMHRFIPSLAVAMGFRVAELPVHHRPRRFGKSKVRPFRRAWKATIDLLGVLWLSRRQFQARALEKGNPDPLSEFGEEVARAHEPAISPPCQGKVGTE
ncbi:Glycosyltransferase [Candidatus Methylacidithermus pantelleriae]|uniref:Glycosyltransferase n=2 Tax=Candidatus Methylacidithermus pantelleriae TaxID=2744239 RepID=A0A8J2FTB3_9BACT|nr:Glycosyltransferase [Candidatus Methylacidithermus pantelleriae]